MEPLDVVQARLNAGVPSPIRTYPWRGLETDDNKHVTATRVAPPPLTIPVSVPVSVSTHSAEDPSAELLAPDPLFRERTQLVVWELERPALAIREDELPTMTNPYAATASGSPASLAIRAVQLSHLECLVQTSNLALARSMILTLAPQPDTAVDAFYQEVLVRVSTSNGMVVESNPLLSFCTGSHNNATPLGSTEQANGA
jgi:hypothetical protein